MIGHMVMTIVVLHVSTQKVAVVPMDHFDTPFEEIVGILRNLIAKKLGSNELKNRL